MKLHPSTSPPRAGGAHLRYGRPRPMLDSSLTPPVPRRLLAQRTSTPGSRGGVHHPHAGATLPLVAGTGSPYLPVLRGRFQWWTCAPGHGPAPLDLTGSRAPPARRLHSTLKEARALSKGSDYPLPRVRRRLSDGATRASANQAGVAGQTRFSAQHQAVASRARSQGLTRRLTLSRMSCRRGEQWAHARERCWAKIN